MKLHHIGIATENIKETIASLQKKLSIKEIGEIIYDPLQDGYLCIVTLEDGSLLEFISGNVVKTYLKKHIYQYHMCYEVNDLEETVEKWEKNGAMLVSAPKEAVLFNGKKVAFLLTEIGLVEFLEK